MSIKINTATCIGCRQCVDICPGNLLHLTGTKKAYIAYPKDCWGCMACVKECPVSAIAYFLGADMGGCGGTMTVRREGAYWQWSYKGADGEQKSISVNTQESNKY